MWDHSNSPPELCLCLDDHNATEPADEILDVVLRPRQLFVANDDYDAESLKSEYSFRGCV